MEQWVLRQLYILTIQLSPGSPGGRRAWEVDVLLQGTNAWVLGRITG